MNKSKYWWLLLTLLPIVAACFLLQRLPAGQTGSNTPFTANTAATPEEEEENEADVGVVTQPTVEIIEPPVMGPVEIRQKLTWEAINSFPIKYADMPIDEARQLCVDFFRFAKTALWTPKESMTYLRNKKGNVDYIYAGTVYGGLPYVGSASGSVYRLMDFMDEATGLVDIAKALTDDNGLSGVVTRERLKYFGSQCSIGAYWGWGRVINHANYRWTYEMVENNGFYRIGPYTYDDGQAKWNDDYTTITVCAENGRQTMYRSYAEFLPGDGMIHYTTGGHVVMCASAAHVEYLENGDIDGDNSFINITDQAQTWVDMNNTAGDRFKAKNNVDVKTSFAELYAGSYVPFTFAEWMGTDPIEDTVCEFSHKGDAITRSQLFAGVVTSNYGISDVYAIVTDERGEEIYRHAVRGAQGGQKSLPLAEKGKQVDTWGTLPAGTYQVEVVVQLGTGERPTVYVGTLKA